jgi:hypothetical protein
MKPWGSSLQVISVSVPMHHKFCMNFLNGLLCHSMMIDEYGGLME